MTDWLEQLTGSRLEGEVRVAEPAINDLLALSSGGRTAPHVTVLEGNRIVVRYGFLHATAQLLAIAKTGESLRVTLILASTMVAWGLRAAVRQPFVFVRGREVAIDIGAVPALAAWRAVWNHIRSVTIATRPGVLVLGIVMSSDRGEAYG
jgi:hypothetical protein